MADPSTDKSSNATHLPQPLVTWAQRRDSLLVTIQVEDCREPQIDLKSTSLHFRGKGGSDQCDYEVLMEFNKEIDPENSKKAVTGRNIFFKINKKDDTSGFWPRLLKDGKKPHWLKTDFDKWVDEDDSDAEVEDHDDMNLEGMMQSMGGLPGGFQGGPAMGGDGEEDSDDEELPDLEGSS